MNLFEFPAHLLTCLVIADFLSGFFHWLEDAYGQPEWPFSGAWITQPNILHHHNPGYFTRHSWLKSAQVPLVLGGATLLLASCFGFLNWMTWLVVAIGVNANEVHKWAHRSKAENGRLLSWLQRIGVLQSPAEHAKHHRNQKNTHYCVVTNYLNPVLDGIRFWNLLETLAYRLLRLQRRGDHSVV